MEAWRPTDWLAALNALLNASAATSLLLGWRAVRRGLVEVHRRWMLTAVGFSAAFLLSYGTRMALAGDTPYAGPEALRPAYYVVLASHVVLSAVLLPMVLVTLRRGLRGRLEAHRALARWTLPVWLYVSVTGVLVFAMLYLLRGVG